MARYAFAITMPIASAAMMMKRQFKAVSARIMMSPSRKAPAFPAWPAYLLAFVPHCWRDHAGNEVISSGADAGLTRKEIDGGWIKADDEWPAGLVELIMSPKRLTIPRVGRPEGHLQISFLVLLTATAQNLRRMTSACPISSRCSPAKFAAREAPTSFRISVGRKRPDARRLPDDTRPVMMIPATHEMLWEGERVCSFCNNLFVPSMEQHI
jgi:hypothetical protein